MLFALLVLAACFVAYTNGANANFKGVASLYGSGTTSLRMAAWWGTGNTFLGALTSLVFARELLKTFSGKGLVPDALTQSPHFVLAVAIGGALTSFLATRFSFPVSTTHALVGALIGAGLASDGHTVHLEPLARLLVQPLLLSPVLAIGLGAILCLAAKAVRILPEQRTRLLDTLHFLSGGAASFARGLNDTPKMAALLLLVPSLPLAWNIIVIAVSMAIGGLLDIRNVAETLGKRVTAMNPGEGFVASLSTALLVCTASYHSLPVSTTHVSVGSLIGIGVVTRKTHGWQVGSIVLTWLVTLPCGAFLAAAALLVINLFR